ncbi:N4-gp56 family major capsid protein [Variovorax sp. H27-G14]|uniref:N4-gp56 family major capsid protein n=1 Tax=Variovorax sp. H27-G14 TaxID=3111914 RepID=UPI0038FCAF84
MALSQYGVNHPLAVKLWAKKLFQEALADTFFAKFMGTSSASLIQIKDETSKGAGDRITIGLRMQLTGDGVQGDGTLEGNEEALATYTDNLFIDQLRHAVRSAGKMSEQRIPFSVRDEAKAGLKDWWQGRLDTWFFNQLGGNTAAIDTRYTGNQAAIAPDANHQLFVTGANDQALGAGNVFTLSMIDKCVETAKTLNQQGSSAPIIRPLRIDGEDKYAMFLHPYQVYDLRTSTNAGQWLDIQKAAMTGGKVEKNPIYTGALGEYNGVVLYQSQRVPTGVNSGTNAAIPTVRRAIFAGAQAGVMAYGKNGSDSEMDWNEELFDYGNQLGVEAGLIAGLKKTRFNNQDFGTIVVSSYAAKH